MVMLVLIVPFFVGQVMLFRAAFIPGIEEQHYERIAWPHQHDREKKNSKSRKTNKVNPGGFSHHCSVDVVEDFFTNHFHESPPKVFDMNCLHLLIAQHPANLFLRTVFIRQYYLDYMDTNPKRHVVYHCNIHCGGLGDRLKAMVSSFFLALSLKATFTVLIECPVHFDEYFETSIPELSVAAPNNFLNQVGLLQQYRQSRGCNSRANYSSLFLTNSTLGFSNASTLSMAHSNKEFNFVFKDWNEHIIKRGFRSSEVEWFRHLNVEGEMTLAASTADSTVALISAGWFRLQPYLFENPAMKDFVNRTHLTGMARPQFSFIFFQLFMRRATPFLQEATQRYRDELAQGKEIPIRGKPYVVGAHIRLGDWTMEVERDNLTNPDLRYPIQAVLCIARRIRDICENKTACVVWIASDNRFAARSLRRLLAKGNIKVLRCDEGEIHHIDLGTFDLSADLRQANLRTFVDWYMLARYMDELVMTQSGFSQWASYYTMRNADVPRPAWILLVTTWKRWKCRWLNFTSYMDRGQQSKQPYLYLP